MPQITVDIGAEQGGEIMSLEYAWIGDSQSQTTVVFLHEGLGSLSSWGRFPDRLCKSLHVRGLLYSRSGYGLSLTNQQRTGLTVNYHEKEALQSLPGLLDALGIQSCYLFGHSDGATIALLAAASSHARRFRGLILLAPHIFVESVTVTGVRKARQAYENGSLKDKIRRHHLDVDAVFYSWNDLWLSAEFQDWDIEARLSAIRCPVIVIQGAMDEYATDAQLSGIVRSIRGAQIIEIPGCGHFPHREAESLVICATEALVSGRSATHENLSKT